MKFQNKNYFIIFKLNIKQIISSIYIIGLASIFVIENIVFSFLINNNFTKSITVGMNAAKQLIYIKLIIDLSLISILNLLLSFILFKKQFDDGMHKLEKRIGIKTKNIFFTRLFILKLYSLVLIFITFLVFLICISAMNNIPKELSLTKLISPFSFYILYDIFISFITILLSLIWHPVIMSLATVLLTCLIVLTPLINSLIYEKNYDTQKEYRILRDITVTNTKLYLGKSFNNFIKQNQEYQFLQDEYQHYDIRWVNELHIWDIYQRVFYFGDVFFPEFEIEFKNNAKQSYQLFEDIDNSLKKDEWINNCRSSDLMFLNGNKDTRSLYKKNSCNIANFSDYLIKKNINNGQYNKLFNFIKKTSKWIQPFNEMNLIDLNIAGTLGGTYFKYGHSENFETPIDGLVANYRTPMQLVYYWYTVNLIRYSMILDNNQLLTLKKQDTYIKQLKFKNNLNIFNHFAFLSLGQVYNNILINDLWAINGSFIKGTINNYYQVKFSDKINSIDPTNGANDFRFEKTSDLDEIEISTLKSISSYEAMYIIYLIVFFTFNIFIYTIYKRKWY